ncbi:MAG: AraC family transcriptional regulator [Rhodanobacter lindaniclasticus]
MSGGKAAWQFPRSAHACLVEHKGLGEVPQLSHGGGGEATRMVCGCIACDSALFKTLLAALPRLTIINMQDGGSRGRWLESSIRFSLDEYADPKAGAGTSRSALAERFTTVIGQPPMQYLAHWRLQLAADRLRSSRGSVMSIAADAGHEPEAAFRREFGSPRRPGAARGRRRHA